MAVAHGRAVAVQRGFCVWRTEIAAELHRREELLTTGSTGVTDQWRVYTHIVNCLRLGSPLRLMVQASAGTGPIHFNT